MTTLQALVLGVLQGLTEFFPVSSSGHLVLGQLLFGIDGDVLVFDIFVHLGTLLAVLVVFRGAILRILAGVYKGMADILGGKPALDVYRASSDVRTAAGIVIGTIPAAVIGVTYTGEIEALFHSASAVFAALGFTGAVLLATFAARPGTRHAGMLLGFVIGLAQALAIIPGISRSGMTIAAGLFLGIRREEAGEFSFLLAVPAILGAAVLAAGDLLDAGVLSIPAVALLTGAAAAFFSGWAALVFLMGIVRRGKLGYFGFYCLAAALAGVVVLSMAG